MARLAIFIDGGYVDRLASDHFDVWIDFSKFVGEITAAVSGKTAEPMDLLRTYYYNCLPYQSNPPSQEERKRFSGKRNFFDALRRLDSFEVREGRLALRGHDGGKPIFQQKRTDLMLGLDFAPLSSKRQITHAALVAGDSDFIPAVQAAKSEGVSAWLFHGPRKNHQNSTYAQELWLESDARFAMTQSFAQSVAQRR